MTRRPEPLVIIGSGGFGRETAEVVRATNEERAAISGRNRWDVLGFLDDEPSRWGTVVSGVPVLGGIDRLAEMPATKVVVCTGHPGDYTSKHRIVRRLGLLPDRYATIVHPTAVVPTSCQLGEGTVVLAGVVVTVDVTVGAHVGIMPLAVLTHDDLVGDFVTVGAGVRLAGGVAVETGAYLGAGCLVRENLRVGSWSLVGMGAVVTRSVGDAEVWAGVPARFVRTVELAREVLTA
ncbi:MAG: NeuD/PglB/VioB family sugar acetyltransferase [Acidimicrobiales bacterium]